jgi:hypothetical protein
MCTDAFSCQAARDSDSRTIKRTNLDDFSGQTLRHSVRSPSERLGNTTVSEKDYRNVKRVKPIQHRRATTRTIKNGQPVGQLRRTLGAEATRDRAYVACPVSCPPYLALISFGSIPRLFQRTWPDAGVSLGIGNLIFESHP